MSGVNERSSYMSVDKRMHGLGIICLSSRLIFEVMFVISTIIPRKFKNDALK